MGNSAVMRRRDLDSSVLLLRHDVNVPQKYKGDIIGSAPTLLSTKEDLQVSGLRYSPDGHSVADIEMGEKDKAILVIRDAKKGEPTKSFAMPAGYSVPWNSPQWILRWTPDGRTLSYALWKG